MEILENDSSNYDVAIPIDDSSDEANREFDRFMGILEALVLRDGADALIFVDTETNAEDVRDGRGYSTGISLTVGLFSKPSTVYIPVRHIDENISRDRLVALQNFFAHFKGTLVFFNAKFDLVSLRTMGIDWQGRFYCTMIMTHLINENLPMKRDLNNCVKMYVSKEESKKDDIAFTTLVKLVGWANVPYGAMRPYAEHDSYITYLLFYAILDKFKKEVPEQYWEHKQNFHRVVMTMEGRGIEVDIDVCREKTQQGVDIMTDLRKKLKGNPGSPVFLKQKLIRELGLPVVKLTKKGLELQKKGEKFDPVNYASFDKAAMEIYDEILEREESPVAQQILTFRGWQKTVSSNYQAYMRLVSPDGRLRPNYKLHGTKTGRLSCEQPNLQQIPRSSEKPWNGDLKRAFVPKPGYQLWEFDYSQLELRLATAYADEKELKKVFAEGRDIFTEMSATLGFDRQDTKGFVYSTQYGAGLDRIAAVFKVSRDKANELRELYRAAYPGFRAVEKRAAQRCKAVGKVQIWSGRYRHFWSKSDDAHKAFNSAIQGGAADIVEHVMVRLFNLVDNEDECRMLLQVHDSVVFEIREDVVEHYVPMIKEIMSNVDAVVPDGQSFGVTFAVEGKVWGSK